MLLTVMKRGRFYYMEKHKRVKKLTFKEVNHLKDDIYCHCFNFNLVTDFLFTFIVIPVGDLPMMGADLEYNYFCGLCSWLQGSLVKRWIKVGLGKA